MLLEDLAQQKGGGMRVEVARQIAQTNALGRGSAHRGRQRLDPAETALRVALGGGQLLPARGVLREQLKRLGISRPGCDQPHQLAQVHAQVIPAAGLQVLIRHSGSQFDRIAAERDRGLEAFAGLLVQLEPLKHIAKLHVRRHEFGLA